MSKHTTCRNYCLLRWSFHVFGEWTAYFFSLSVLINMHRWKAQWDRAHPNHNDVRYLTGFVYRLPTPGYMTLSGLGLQECQAIAKGHEKLAAACFYWPNSALSAKENITELRYADMSLSFPSLPCSDSFHPFYFIMHDALACINFLFLCALTMCLCVTKPIKIYICCPLNSFSHTDRCNKNVCDNSAF